MTSFTFGASRWPGLAKVIEEAAELLTVAGKLIVGHGHSDPWGTRHNRPTLVHDLEEEIADTQAAIDFLIESSPELDHRMIQARREEKLKKFRRLHNLNPSPKADK